VQTRKDLLTTAVPTSEQQIARFGRYENYVLPVRGSLLRGFMTLDGGT